MTPRDKLSTVYMDEMYPGGLHPDEQPVHVSRKPLNDSRVGAWAQENLGNDPDIEPNGYVFQARSVPVFYKIDDFTRRQEEEIAKVVDNAITGQIGHFHRAALENAERMRVYQRMAQ